MCRKESPLGGQSGEGVTQPLLPEPSPASLFPPPSTLHPSSPPDYEITRSRRASLPNLHQPTSDTVINMPELQALPHETQSYIREYAINVITGVYGIGNGTLYGYALAELVKYSLEVFASITISRPIELYVASGALAITGQLMQHVFRSYRPKIEKMLSPDQLNLTIRGFLTGLTKGTATYYATSSMLITLIAPNTLVVTILIQIIAIAVGVCYATAEAAFFSEADRARKEKLEELRRQQQHPQIPPFSPRAYQMV